MGTTYSSPEPARLSITAIRSGQFRQAASRLPTLVTTTPSPCHWLRTRIKGKPSRQDLTNPIPIRRQPKPSEEGYMLLAVIFLLALLMISLTVALPKIAKEIQRDRELETMQRGKQYSRAVKMYYKKFGRYPPNIDALVKTSEIRYLRKKYKDPTTGKEEWKPIMLGQNKAPTAMGFFGQPIAGTTMAGVGPGGGNSNGILGASPIVPTDPTAGTNPTDPNNPTANPTDPTGTGAGAGAGGVTNPTGPTFGGAEIGRA